MQREIMLFIGKPMGRSIMISNEMHEMQKGSSWYSRGKAIYSYDSLGIAFLSPSLASSLPPSLAPFLSPPLLVFVHLGIQEHTIITRVNPKRICTLFKFREVWCKFFSRS
jgi:hypothetical protein